VLLEASAGTGKTYAIATLVLRLVAEVGLGIHEVLVVTFTEAATTELRDRVRRRLRDAPGRGGGRARRRRVSRPAACTTRPPATS
jgi:exodeoxyribonuclease V beta subunit